MCHHDDGVILFQFYEKVLHGLAGDRVQGTRSLVSQNEIRLHGKTPGEAKPLLLTDGKPHGRALQPVFHLFPQAHLGEVFFHDIIQLGFLRMHAMDAAAVSHIVKYGHRKRTRTLRH